MEQATINKLEELEEGYLRDKAGVADAMAIALHGGLDRNDAFNVCEVLARYSELLDKTSLAKIEEVEQATA